MEIPTVPTDNLYKFMAIVGVLMIPGAIIFDQYFELQLLKLDTEVAISQSEYRAKLDKTFEDIKTHAGELGRFADDYQTFVDGLHSAPTKAEKLRWLEYVKKTKEQKDKAHAEALASTQQLTDISIERNRFLGKELVVAFMKTRIFVVRWLAVSGALTGLVLAGLGFYWWYMRSQRFQDQELSRRAVGELQSAKDPA
jgi:hypothetical protein